MSENLGIRGEKNMKLQELKNLITKRNIVIGVVSLLIILVFVCLKVSSCNRNNDKTDKLD